ncbi:MAG: type II toxin-antitoxin system RelE/ParE family toxin [Asticcacaulis sp.]
MKLRQVVFAPEAIEDLSDLYDYVAATSSEATALAYLDRIRSFCQGFDLASERGTRRDDIRPGLRLVGFERRITLAFVVTKTRVIFLRVFYGGQNWQTRV